MEQDFSQISTNHGHNLIYAMVLFVAIIPKDSVQGPNERRLLEDIFNHRNYNKLERPVANESEALNVTFGLTLQQIIEVHEKNQIINTNIWLNIVWNDSNLAWREEDYGGIKSIRVPPTQLWKPDILMYNSADEDIDSTFPTNVVVSSGGGCLWVPPGLFLSTCKINIKWFPFDDQKCDMKFGSWTYDSSGINLQLESEKGDMSSFIENGEWVLLDVTAKRNVRAYECCPEQYIDITFTIHIRRRTLYYGFNLIIPCVLISSMTLLTFALPPDAGEKISLGVTVMLSLTVFLLLVAEAMPPTSDAVPLIGMYFSAIMLMCSLSVVCTVLVLNFHHRSPDTHVMPYWIKRCICGTLAWALFMKRPGGNDQSSRLSKKQAHRAKLREQELRDRSSKSLLANVLDIDDLFLLRTKLDTTRQTSFNSPSNLELSNATALTTALNSTTNSVHFNNATFQPDIFTSTLFDAAPVTPCSEVAEERQHHEEQETRVTRLLADILDHLQQVTERLKKEEERQDECSDWKFAAMVIDRLCLVSFTIGTIVSTFVILYSAPNVVLV